MNEEPIMHEVITPEPTTQEFELHDPKPQEITIISIKTKKVLRPWYEMLDNHPDN